MSCVAPDYDEGGSKALAKIKTSEVGARMPMSIPVFLSDEA